MRDSKRGSKAEIRVIVEILKMGKMVEERDSGSLKFNNLIGNKCGIIISVLVAKMV
jgi:hypothetical protein